MPGRQPDLDEEVEVRHPAPLQGGAELGLWTKIPIELRTVVQGLVILFTGALDMMVRMLLTYVFALFRQPKLETA